MTTTKLPSQAHLHEGAEREISNPTGRPPGTETLGSHRAVRILLAKVIREIRSTAEPGDLEAAKVVIAGCRVLAELLKHRELEQVEQEIEALKRQMQQRQP